MRPDRVCLIVATLALGTSSVAGARRSSRSRACPRDRRRLVINEFDIDAGAYTGRHWSYRLESAAHAIGDLARVARRAFLVVERDNLQGDAAQFKKVFLVSLDACDGHGFLVKQEVANLLQLRDPGNVGGRGALVRFPVQTIESVIPLGDREIGLLDDNNYPLSSGRVQGPPDPNEFIVIRLDRTLRQYAQELRAASA